MLFYFLCGLFFWVPLALILCLLLYFTSLLSTSLSLSLSLFFLKSGYFLKLETVSRRGLSFCMEGSLLHPARRAGVFFCELEHIM